jgi:hypothetical protein
MARRESLASPKGFLSFHAQTLVFLSRWQPALFDCSGVTGDGFDQRRGPGAKPMSAYWGTKDLPTFQWGSTYLLTSGNRVALAVGWRQQLIITITQGGAGWPGKRHLVPAPRAGS